MPQKLKDMTGKRFGRLAVIEYAGPPGMWRCRCDCGTKKVIRGGDLRRIKSCGCLVTDTLRKRNYKHGDAQQGNVKPEYRSWCGMIKRCTNAASPSYMDYGGRGISVCERWRNGDDHTSGYQYFLLDMGRKPTPEHSLDRINNDGNYEPGNCRWATNKTQMRNRRGRKMVAFQGRKMPLSQAAELAGLPYDIVQYRVSAGWPVDVALATPVLPLFGGVGAARYRNTPAGRAVAGHQTIRDPKEVIVLLFASLSTSDQAAVMRRLSSPSVEDSDDGLMVVSEEQHDEGATLVCHHAREISGI